jgi:hypothetical protein
LWSLAVWQLWQPALLASASAHSWFSGAGGVNVYLTLLRLFLARGEQLIGGKRSEGDEQQARQQQLPVDGGHRAAQPVSTPGSH